MAPRPSDGRAEQPLGSDAAARLAEQAQAMPTDDPRRTAASLAMFDRLSEHWSLRADERETLLGGVSKSTWSEWRGRRMTARIKPDTRERIANLFLIDLNAHSLFAPEFADRWIRERNAAFHGESPMTTMLRGKVEDVISVRRYLERVRTSSSQDAADGKAASSAEPTAVRLLPGDGAVSNEEAGAAAALRHAVNVYERLALENPTNYEDVLVTVLNAYATCLLDIDEPEAAAVLQRLIEIQRPMARRRSYKIRDLQRSLFLLSDLMKRRGDQEAANSLFGEAFDMTDPRRKALGSEPPMREKLTNAPAQSTDAGSSPPGDRGAGS